MTDNLRRVAQRWRHARHIQPTDIGTGCQSCFGVGVLEHRDAAVVKTVGLKDCAQSGPGEAFLGSSLPSKIGQAKSNIRQKTRTSTFLVIEDVRFLNSGKLLVLRGQFLVSSVK